MYGVVIFVLLILCFGSFGIIHAYADTFTISGSVAKPTDPLNPIPGVHEILVYEHGTSNPPTTIYTDPNGNFSTLLNEGVKRFEVNPDFCNDLAYGYDVPGLRLLDGVLTGVTLFVPETSFPPTIQVDVFDSNSDPVSDAVIEIDNCGNTIYPDSSNPRVSVLRSDNIEINISQTAPNTCLSEPQTFFVNRLEDEQSDVGGNPINSPPENRALVSNQIEVSGMVYGSMELPVSGIRIHAQDCNGDSVEVISGHTGNIGEYVLPIHKVSTTIYVDDDTDQYQDQDHFEDIDGDLNNYDIYLIATPPTTFAFEGRLTNSEFRHTHGTIFEFDSDNILNAGGYFSTMKAANTYLMNFILDNTASDRVPQTFELESSVDLVSDQNDLELILQEKTLEVIITSRSVSNVGDPLENIQVIATGYTQFDLNSDFVASGTFSDEESTDDEGVATLTVFPSTHLRVELTDLAGEYHNTFSTISIDEDTTREFTMTSDDVDCLVFNSNNNSIFQVITMGYPCGPAIGPGEYICINPIIADPPRSSPLPKFDVYPFPNYPNCTPNPPICPDDAPTCGHVLHPWIFELVLLPYHFGVITPTQALLAIDTFSVDYGTNTPVVMTWTNWNDSVGNGGEDPLPIEDALSLTAAFSVLIGVSILAGIQAFREF